MGQIGQPPFFYFIHRAAKILGCSFLELEHHPERFRLMSLAFTLESGKNQGDRILKQNPEYKALIKQMAKEEHG